VCVQECMRECVSFFLGRGVVESWCAACVMWHTVVVKGKECVRVCESVRECVRESVS